MSNLTERKRALETDRANALASMESTLAPSLTESRELTEDEQAVFDAAKAAVEKADRELSNINRLIEAQAATARPVIEQRTVPLPTDSTVARVEPVPLAATTKGQDFVRYAMALAATRGNLVAAVEYSKRWSAQSPRVEAVLRAAVAAGTTTDSAWAGPLVTYQQMSSEFIELLMPATIIGRVPDKYMVPFNVRIPRQTTGGLVKWVGQGTSKPVGAMGFDSVTMPFSKAAGIVVLTDELVRFSQPSAESVVRRSLIDTMVLFLDQQFIDPAVAAVANVSPAAITNGAPTVPSTGVTIAQIEADAMAALAILVNNNIPLTGACWVMRPMSKMNLASRRTAVDVLAWPTVAANGTWFGLPIIESNAVPVQSAPVDSIVALISGPSVMLADDGQTVLDASREAYIQMDSSPATPPTGGHSMWQENMVAIKAERFINWQRVRNNGVVVITDTAW